MTSLPGQGHVTGSAKTKVLGAAILVFWHWGPPSWFYGGHFGFSHWGPPSWMTSLPVAKVNRKCQTGSAFGFGVRLAPEQKKIKKIKGCVAHVSE